MTTPHAKSNAREGDGVAVTDAMIRQFVDGMGAPYCFDAPPPSAIRAGLAAAMQAQQGAEPVALRQAVADYIGSEGCSCCQGDEHDQHAKRLAELLDVPPYSDGSGYDFSLFRTGAPR